MSSSPAPSTPNTVERGSPLIVGSDAHLAAAGASGARSSPYERSAAAGSPATKIPERFFLIKSLTLQDLVASVTSGTWEAQEHNEDMLNQAFDNSDNMYLILSENKSGEYFGLARMTSALYLKTAEDSSTAESASLARVKSLQPRSIPTEANDVAPSGHIYDDSERGTIFWEADRAPAINELEDASKPGQRKQFNIEWVSTSRVPFFRTRGLRNPWNGSKEVKIARDGTELEPNVGRQLARLFG